MRTHYLLMMLPYHIKPLSKSLQHTIKSIGSKSQSHRVLVLAAFAQGPSTIRNLNQGEDVQATIEALKSLNIPLQITPTEVKIMGNPNLAHETFVKNMNFQFHKSGTSLRFFMSILSLFPQKISISGTEQLENRPIDPLLTVLKHGGVQITYLKSPGSLPLVIQGPFRGGNYQIGASMSSQYVSSLMLIGAHLQNGLHLKIPYPIHSHPYIHLTHHLMTQFGLQVKSFETDDALHISIPGNQHYKGKTVTIDGDYSNSAYFLVVGAIMGGKITIQGLQHPTHQGDAYIIEVLQKMGCEIKYTAEDVTLYRDNSHDLQGLSEDLGDHPDLVCPLAIACLFAKNPSVFTNIEHLQYKESNRLKVLTQYLHALGANISYTSSSLTITPQAQYTGIIIDPHDDHRIAMSFAIAGLKIPGMIIQTPECVAKSHPGFFHTLETLYS